MKKYYILLTTVLLHLQFCMGQHEFYIAMQVEDLMEDEIFQLASQSEGIALLDSIPVTKIPNKALADRIKNLSKQDSIDLVALIQAFYGNHKFTNSLNCEKVKHLLNTLEPGAKAQGGDAVPAFGVSQAEIITAIADVVIERAKQELAKMYFDRLATKIDNGITVYYGSRTLSFHTFSGATSHTVELEHVLPNIYSFLRNSADRMTPEMGQTFKNAFTKDLENLLPRMVEYGFPPDYKRDHLVDDFAMSSYDFIKNLIANAGFYVASDDFLASMILSLPGNTGSPIDRARFADVLSTIRVLNSSLVNDKGKYIVNAAQCKNLKPATYAIYLQLLSCNPNLPANVATRLANVDKDQFNRFVSGIDKVRLTLNEIGNLESTPEKISAIGLACISFLDAYSSGVSLTGDLITIDPATLQNLEQFAGYSRSGIEFATSLYNQNYSSAALVVLNFIQRSYSDPTINKDLFKYITLIADISQAQNTQEVRTIIDRAILPVGSYAIKQSTRFSLSVNAYAGVSGGIEWNKFGDKNASGSSGTLGFSLPIGVSVSCSKGNEDNMSASNTLFASLLDLGAIANYNLGKTNIGEGQISTAPEITFANVFSPGIAYIHGFKKSPVAFMIGMQYMPRLREIKDADNITLGEADAAQLKLGLLVDVPLFNIVMKGRK